MDLKEYLVAAAAIVPVVSGSAVLAVNYIVAPLAKRLDEHIVADNIIQAHIKESLKEIKETVDQMRDYQLGRGARR